jgi:hypothetical protein
MSATAPTNMAADAAVFSREGWIGPAFPVAVFPIRIDADPLPLGPVAIERIRFLLSQGVALRVLATEQRWIDRLCAAVEALGDDRPGACDA